MASRIQVTPLMKVQDNRGGPRRQRLKVTMGRGANRQCSPLTRTWLFVVSDVVQIADDAVEDGGGVAGQDAAGECHRPRIVEDAAAVKGGVAGQDAVGEWQRPEKVEDAAAVAVVGGVAGEGAVHNRRRPDIIDAT